VCATGAKRLELLRQLVPKADAIAMLVNPDYPSAATEVRDVQEGAHTLGFRINVANAVAASDFEPAFAGMAAQRSAAVLVADDPFLQSRRDELVALAAQRAMPAIYFSRDFVQAGGLMSYGPDINDAYRLVGVYIGRILKGERPADLPVMQPTKFELLINLKTAKALRLAPTLLALADDWAVRRQMQLDLDHPYGDVGSHHI
jgi:putative ABC transport system substrate-binding protein